MPPVDIRMLLPFLVSEGGNWTLSRDGLAIQRGVQFGTFKETHVSGLFRCVGCEELCFGWVGDVVFQGWGGRRCVRGVFEEYPCVWMIG